MVQRKIMSYTLQDLRCSRCKQIKRENMGGLCSCAGEYETLISAADLRKLFQTFLKIAEEHQMPILEEHVDLMLKNS